MLNFDMVGRLRQGPLVVGGGDSASGLRALVAEAARGTGGTIEGRGTPWTPADHPPAAVERLAAAPRPAYARVAPPTPRGAAAGAGLGGAFLGIVAAPRPAPDGLWISGILPRRAAAAARRR